MKAADTVCRAVAFPVTPTSCAWKDLDPLLAAAWAEATALANWAVLEMAKADVARTPAMAELPPAPRVPLYRLFQAYAGRAAWAGAAAAANCVLRAVQRKYLKERFDVVWRRARALPTFRYPHPFPVHNQAWACRLEGKDAVPTVTLGLPGGRVEVRMANRAEMRRQVALFRLLADGTAKRGEAALYKKGKHTLLKLVGHFPRPKDEGLTGTLCVRTDPHAFWVSEQDGRAPWVVNADHVRRWAAAHHAYLQRVAEDTKHEKRWPAGMRRHINRSRALRCRKHNDRLATWCHEAAKMLAQFALRQKAAEVLYDDQDLGYLASFPWARLRENLKNKLDERGIVLTAAPPARGAVGA